MPVRSYCGRRAPGGRRVVVLARGQVLLLAVGDRDERAVARERDPAPVRRPRRLNRLDLRPRDPLRRPAGEGHRVDVVVAAVDAALERQRLPVRRPRGERADVAEIGEPAVAGAVGVHHEDLLDRVAGPPVVVGDQLPVRGVRGIGRRAEALADPGRRAARRPHAVQRPLAREDDPAAVGRPRGVVVAVLGVRHPPGARAVGVHHEDVRPAVAVGGEGDLRAVARPRRLVLPEEPFGRRRVRLVVGQPVRVLPVRIGAVDRVVAVLDADEDERRRALRPRTTRRTPRREAPRARRGRPRRAASVLDRLDAEVAPLELRVARDLLRGRLGCDLAADHHELPLGERRSPRRGSARSGGSAGPPPRASGTSRSASR